MEQESVKLARTWITCWNEGRPDDIPLAADFTHNSPYGIVSGRDAYLDWVKPLAEENVMDLRIIRCVGDENEAAIWFEMDTPGAGTVRVVDWVSTQDGEILSINSFYDPTGLAGLDQS